jgi:hypothetical protein
MKILVFLHGTAIMHQNALGRAREERVKQVLDGEASVDDYTAYVPVGEAARKLRAWSEGGAEILYLSSHRKAADVEKDRAVLEKHGFPAGPVYFRQGGEGYGDVAGRLLPDILVEDDCESIGGEEEMTYPHIRPELRIKIKSIVVKEFGGIDHLPDDLMALLSY